MIAVKFKEVRPGDLIFCRDHYCYKNPATRYLCWEPVVSVTKVNDTRIDIKFGSGTKYGYSERSGHPEEAIMIKKRKKQNGKI